MLRGPCTSHLSPTNVIQQVIELGPKLEISSLREGKLLADSGVHAEEAGQTLRSNTRVSELAVGGLSVGARAVVDSDAAQE